MSLNLRLVALVVAMLALIIGGIAVISVRVAHVEIRKVVTTTELRARLAPGETLVGYYNRMVMGHPGIEIMLFDANRKLVGSSIFYTRYVLQPDGELRFDIGPAHFILKGPEIVVHDAAGNLAGWVYRMPAHDAESVPPQPPPTRALDRSFTWIFTGAALFGIVMAVLIARLITGPVERLTAAARQLEGGDFAVRVDPGGGPELGGLARAFNAMADTLNRNEELRRRMVSDVAHELRAPLTNIRCELESMQDGLSLARVDSLHEEVMHLTRLVDDLQDLALAEAGKLEMHPEAFALAPLVRRAHANAEGPDDLMVMADPTRVTQILANLLSNARRHADEVRVVWRRDGDRALVQVIDNGVGISADELPRIFDRFHRVDAARGRHTGGAGLGLSIVQQLVAAQGGRVWAESEVGKGSTFSFTLPLAV